jgi:hypothetical protein
MSERFKVSSVLGLKISPRSDMRASGMREPVRSWVVLDSAFGYRIVEQWNANSDSLAGDLAGEEAAIDLCAKLNTWDDEYGLVPVAEFAP